MTVCFVVLSGCDNQDIKEGDEVCQYFCSTQNNWAYGESAGYGYCNCYNLTITNKVEDGVG